MKKILVVDWLDKYGGAERVLTSLNKSYNFSRCYTLINNMSEENLKKVFQHNDIEIIESMLKLLKSKFRYLFFLFPYFISNLSQEKNKCLIISSSFAVAKGFRSKKNQLHICYFQARNQRYIWDEENIYFTKLQAFILNPILSLLRKIDIRQSKRPDFIVANSFFVKDWIKKHYKIDCEVIYPPVDTKLFKLEKNKSGYYITTARLEPYKRIDLIVEAFNNINEELYIVGDGSTKKSLKAKANENIKFYDFLDALSVMNLVSKAKAFIHAR
jgi:glycosyltransferase involved in cell wall biosynthesis